MKFSDVKRSSMELHIMRLVEHLKNKEDSQAGFMSAIDNALSHARFLEEAYFKLHTQNEELREKCRMPMPVLDFRMGIAFEYKSFYWQMQVMGYRNRIPVPPLAMFNAENEIFWKLVRRQSYRGFLKLFRKTFDENFERFLANYKK